MCIYRIYVLGAVIGGFVLGGGEAWGQEGRLAYPTTRRVNAVDLYHGVKVADPYRWLEAMESGETLAWVKAQDRLFLDFVGQGSIRDALEARVREINSFESSGSPVKGGQRFFIGRTAAGASRSNVYVQEGLDGEPRTLIDQAQLFADDSLRLNGWVPIPDGRLLAFGESKGQSGWLRARFLEVDTGEIRKDVLVGLGNMGSVQGKPVTTKTASSMNAYQNFLPCCVILPDMFDSKLKKITTEAAF